MNSPADLRNVVLVGSSGSGKTTLFENLIKTRIPGYRGEKDDAERLAALTLATITTGESTVINLLDAPGNTGMSLTESFAMLPAAAVSGYYFSHPRSQYFVVGRVSKAQVEDYARRKGVPLAQAERWLASNLDYDPE